MSLAPIAVEEWIIGRVAEMCDVDRADVRPGDPFRQHGMNSLGLTGLTVELAELLGRPVPATAVWTYPTPRDLARHLTGFEPVRAEQPVARAGDPIAIVGLACRLPGGRGPDEFWRLLRE